MNGILETVVKRFRCQFFSKDKWGVVWHLLERGLQGGYSGDIAGLKCHALSSVSSLQCRGTAGLFIPCPYQPE